MNRLGTVGGLFLLLLLSVTGCGSSNQKVTIRVEGSDTMVNLAQAWAEEYNKTHDVSIQVSGGGSGVGIASLIDGVADLANASRKMKDKELARAEQNTGKKPVEFIVGLDALAIYTHKDNPMETISIEQLADIYGDGGSVTKWRELNVDNVACSNDEITRVSRQNNSGTYHYFREAVLGENRDFKLGSIDQSGSKDVVALVSKTPCAIGYSGMGYKTDDVNWLKVSKTIGGEGVAPSVASASDGSYPIARPLHIYTLGEPTGPIKEYLDWIMSEAGQKVVLDLGYVPLKLPQQKEAANASDTEKASDADGAAGQDPADTGPADVDPKADADPKANVDPAADGGPRTDDASTTPERGADAVDAAPPAGDDA